MSSAACGLAPDVETLVGARIGQGAAAAAIGPTVLSLIGDVYDGPHRGRALGAYATVIGVAAALGQLLLLAAVEHVGTGGSVLWLVPGRAGLSR